MPDLWTAEDVERVATATEQHYIADYDTTDAMGNHPCVCGRWWDAAGDNPGWDQHMAEVAVAALAEAGRLAPDGAREQWGVRMAPPSQAWGDGVEPYDHETVARDVAAERSKPLLSRWVGPWQPVEPEEPKP